MMVGVVTWNVAGQAVSEQTRRDVASLVEASRLGETAVVAVGLQEVSASVTSLAKRVTSECPWPQLFRAHLAPLGFVHVSCVYNSRPRLLGSVLLVFLRRELLPRLLSVSTRTLSTGLSGYSPHKGTVALQLRFRDHTNITFLDSHFAPHSHQLPTRIKEYRMVTDGVRFTGGPSSLATISDDYVIWLGDLNFRVDYYSVEEAARLAEARQLDVLRSNDQLSRVRREKEAFAEFQEGPLSFPPSYRFSIGERDAYDRQRLPSWCDRVLFRVSEVTGLPKRRPPDTLHLQQISYSSHPDAIASDHKPVSALFSLQLSWIPEDLEWPVHFDETLWLAGTENLCSYVIRATDFIPASFDWIAIYPIHFCSDVDDMITWSYALTAWEDEGTMRLIFKRQHIPPPGDYLLGYFSRQRQCLVGLSSPISIAQQALEA